MGAKKRIQSDGLRVNIFKQADVLLDEYIEVEAIPIYRAQLKS
jgi:hypothetical protein